MRAYWRFLINETPARYGAVFTIFVASHTRPFNTNIKTNCTRTNTLYNDINARRPNSRRVSSGFVRTLIVRALGHQVLRTRVFRRRGTIRSPKYTTETVIGKTYDDLRGPANAHYVLRRARWHVSKSTGKRVKAPNLTSDTWSNGVAHCVFVCRSTRVFRIIWSARNTSLQNNEKRDKLTPNPTGGRTTCQIFFSSSYFGASIAPCPFCALFCALELIYVRKTAFVHSVYFARISSRHVSAKDICRTHYIISSFCYSVCVCVWACIVNISRANEQSEYSDLTRTKALETFTLHRMWLPHANTFSILRIIIYFDIKLTTRVSEYMHLRVSKRLR